MCINCSFVHLCLQFYYSLDDISYFGLYSCTCVQAVFDNAIGFSDPDFLYEGAISAIGKRLRPFLAIFLYACADTALFVLPV